MCINFTLLTIVGHENMADKASVILKNICSHWNMNIKGTLNEGSDVNKEHVIGNGRKNDPYYYKRLSNWKWLLFKIIP